MQIISVAIIWSDDAERYFQAFVKQNQNGVFPPTRENYIQAVFQDAITQKSGETNVPG